MSGTKRTNAVGLQSKGRELVLPLGQTNRLVAPVDCGLDTSLLAGIDAEMLIGSGWWDGPCLGMASTTTLASRRTGALR